MSYSQKKEHKSTFVYLLGIYFLLLIFGALNIGPIGSVLRLVGLLPIAIWVLSSHKIVKNKLLIFVFLFVLWCCFSYVWSIDQTLTSKRIITQISFLIFLFAVSAYSYNKTEIFFLKSMLVWASRLSAIVVLLFSNYIEGRLYLSGVIDEDPNYLCTYFLFAIINAIISITKPIGKKKIVYFFEILIYIYIILSTGSRGGALATGVAIVIAYIMSIKESDLTFLSFLGRIFLIAILAAAIYILTSYLSEDILLRYSYATIAESNGTGRYQIWKDAMNLFGNSNFLRQLGGYGTGTAKVIAREYHFTYVNVIHNIFIENLVELGIVGFLFYVIYTFRFWNCSRIMKDTFSFSIISGMIIMSLSTSLAAFKPYWNILIFIICMNNYVEVSDDGSAKINENFGRKLHG